MKKILKDIEKIEIINEIDETSNNKDISQDNQQKDNKKIIDTKPNNTEDKYIHINDIKKETLEVKDNKKKKNPKRIKIKIKTILTISLISIRKVVSIQSAKENVLLFIT